MAREQIQVVAAPRDLGRFLSAMRRRIDPGGQMLGPHARLPARWRRPVTQEELAEAVDVSRRWYGMLESGATLCSLTSPPVAYSRTQSQTTALFCEAEHEHAPHCRGFH